MRIVSGEYKGRRLEMPENYDIRPTSEKVKEAIFSIISGNVPDAVCIDLFSGTGSIGLEALSRGAAKCYFGDNSKSSLELTKRNIKMCRAEEKSIVISGDFEKVLSRIGERNEKADIIFLDPPYKMGLYSKCFEIIENLNLLSQEGIIVAEHDSKDEFEPEIGSFKKLKEKKYGSIGITI